MSEKLSRLGRASLFILFTAMTVAIVVLALRLRDEQGPLDAEAVAAVATKSSPPAVTSGPPRGICAPVFGGSFASAGAVTPPSGMRHLISPVFKSYAVISDHGGPIAVMPLVGLCMKSYGDV